ncbi:MAG: PhnD/SsuA/transferrin family substrate-binding protein [Proteobacteria bacterium]|nr:PhnD/SsuA/transferrin family substrate-binding protein [Pseudomonadota bacterium]
MLHLDQVIGQGAFGTVFLGRMRSPDGLVSRVAVKLLSREMSSDSRAVQRFRDEARLLALVDLPGIVPVYGIHRIDDRWAVVMGFVDGVALNEPIRVGGLPPSVVAEVGAQIAELLYALHHHVHPETSEPLDVVHRDVKPHNIMVEASGRARLLDLGVAQARFEARETRTMDGEVAGTLAYMSPQRWAREDDGHAGDIYSLGVTLLHLLTGELPPRLGWDEAAHVTNLETAIGEHRDSPLYEWIARAAAWDDKQRPNGASLAQGLRGLDVPGPSLREWAIAYMGTRTMAESFDGVGSDVMVLGNHSVGDDTSETLLTTGLFRAPVIEDEPTGTMEVATPASRPWVLPLAMGLWSAAAVALGVGVWATSTPVDTSPVTVLLSPTVDAAVLLEENEPLRDYLERELGRQVIFEVGESYQDVSDRIVAGTDHYAVLPYRAGQATLAADPEIQELALKVVDGSTTVDGYLVIRGSDPATSLGELVGSTVCYANNLSNTGYKLPRKHIEDAGFDPEHDFVTRLSGDHEAVLRDLNAGDCRLGGTFSHNFSTAGERGIDTSGLRLFAITGRIPHDSIWAAPEADPRTSDLIRKALLDLNPIEDVGTERIGKSERISGFLDPDAVR